MTERALSQGCKSSDFSLVSVFFTSKPLKIVFRMLLIKYILRDSKKILRKILCVISDLFLLVAICEVSHFCQNPTSSCPSLPKMALTKPEHVYVDPHTQLIVHSVYRGGRGDAMGKALASCVVGLGSRLVHVCNATFPCRRFHLQRFGYQTSTR